MKAQIPGMTTQVITWWKSFNLILAYISPICKALYISMIKKNAIRLLEKLMMYAANNVVCCRGKS